MPQSRNRAGHHYQKPSDVPASQRVKGRVIWAVLFAVFAGLIAFFAAGENYLVVIIAAVAGGAIGFAVGKNAERTR